MLGNVRGAEARGVDLDDLPGDVVVESPEVDPGLDADDVQILEVEAQRCEGRVVQHLMEVG